MSSSPKLHREFRKAVNKLPKTYSPENKQRYYKLIDNFGTHYITKVSEKCSVTRVCGAAAAIRQVLKCVPRCFQVTLGGSVQSVTSIRQCKASLQGLSVEEVQMCLEMEAAASVGVGSVKAESKHCKTDIDKTESKSSFSSLFNDR